MTRDLSRWIYDRRLKQKDVAAYLKMSTEHISRVCCGKAKLSETAWRLLDLYDLEHSPIMKLPAKHLQTKAARSVAGPSFA